MSDAPSNLRVTLRDIAKRVNVSHVTVSLALRDHPRISKSVRDLIKATAKEMGYRPDPMLAALAHYRQSRVETSVRAAIAWINCWQKPKLLRTYKEFDAYWRGASQAAEKFGYHLEEFVVNDKMPVHRLEKVLVARGVRGVLLPPIQGSLPPHWDDINWNHFSVVRFSRGVSSPNAHLVASDQASNMVLAFNKIRTLGYQRIGFVGTQTIARMFAGGFFVAQSAIPESQRVPALQIQNNNLTELERQLAPWVKKHKPDAIITDYADLRQRLERIGYKVPSDIGLAGTSILDVDAEAGIDQNPEEIGRVSVLVAISLINDNHRGIPDIFRQVLISGRWVDGKSMPNRNG
ncbi:MAG: LacI family DNA-binding transcriptional regulator [Chthoniobacteraceae bacterium]